MEAESKCEPGGVERATPGEKEKEAGRGGGLKGEWIPTSCPA